MYLLPIAVFPVTLRAAQAGGGLCVVLAGATCAIMLITGVCMSITLTPAKERRHLNYQTTVREENMKARK